MLNAEQIQEGALDFRYLLNRGYPRKATLELVGNRYQLTSDLRHLLHRGVFSNADSKLRSKKRLPIKAIRDKKLAIDGYNVSSAVEAGLSGQPLVLGDDGFIRDISGLSGRFKKTERTQEAIRMVLNVLKRMKPLQILFLFDAPISRSGQLAQEIRERLKREHIPGDARAVKVPEIILNRYPGVIATSDTAIIDQSEKVVDLAGATLRQRTILNSLFRLNKKRTPCVHL